MAQDHYAVLGVDRNASADEIKRAYRRLARTYHPDANPGDREAEARFKEVALAYETLSDPDRRRRYDVFGDDSTAGQPFGGGFGDVFEMFFGQSPFGGAARGPAGPPRGQDLEATVTVELADVLAGTEAPVTVRTAITCDDCEATGCAPGSGPATCGDCGGTGQVRRVRQSLLGQMVTASPCQRCGGAGQWIERPCRTCRGEGRIITERSYTVDVPAGIDDGQTLRLSGRGAVGPRGGGAGDLYVHVRVLPHPTIHREGLDLHLDVEVPVVQAALGAELTVELLDGIETVAVDPGTQSGDVVRFRGRGMPRLDGRNRGDVVVHLQVRTPHPLSDEEEALLRQLAEHQGLPVRDPDGRLLTKLKSAFR